MAGLAASRSIDERRRRHLAVDTKDAAKKGDTASRIAATGPRKESPSDIPLSNLISNRLWKIWGAALLALLGAAAVVAGGWAVSHRPGLLGPGLVGLFDLGAGRALRTYSGLLFLGAGQLSLLICWTRAQSLQDFNARYRAWAWVGAAGVVTGIAVLLEAHAAWVNTLFWKWNPAIPHRELLASLIPATVVGLVCLRLMHVEMRRHRPGFIMLWLAAVSFGALALLQFGVAPAAIRGLEPLANAGLGLFAQSALFAGLMLHARFVIYDSAEPPKEKAKPAKPAATVQIAEVPKAKAARKEAEKTVPAPADDAAARKSPKRPESKPAESARASQSASEDEYDDDDDFDDGNQRSSRKYRLHSAHERHEMLKGLSKRERRQMRKQWRDQERAIAEGEE